MLNPDHIIRAEKNIRPYLIETPLLYSSALSKHTGCNVWLKMENLQVTGSFKARGALNKILAIKASQPSAEIITASTGNHGLGVANALSVVNMSGMVYLPEHASLTKVNAIRERGVPVSFYGKNAEQTEAHARTLDGTQNQVYVSPYNDADVIAGQGTIGVELYKQLPSVDSVFIAVGGGGLISGVACYLKSVNPAIRIIGCLPENAAAMYTCIQAGKIMEVAEKETLSEATAGGVEPGAITFDLCRAYVDEYVLVSEQEIFTAMKSILHHHHTLIEGSAGVAVAAITKSKERHVGKNAVAIICGGNIKELPTLE